MNANTNDIAAETDKKLAPIRVRKRKYAWSRPIEIAAGIILTMSYLTMGDLTGAENTSAGSRVFNGINAHFRIINPSIRRDEPLKVSLTLKNISRKSVAFRFTGPLVAGIYVYDSERNRLSFRNGASLGEYPAADITLKPGEVFNTVLSGTPGDYYDLKPGNYYLRFVYDLRGITNEQLASQYMSKYGSRDIVMWDTRWYSFSVVN